MHQRAQAQRFLTLLYIGIFVLIRSGPQAHRFGLQGLYVKSVDDTVREFIRVHAHTTQAHTHTHTHTHTSTLLRILAHGYVHIKI